MVQRYSRLKDFAIQTGLGVFEREKPLRDISSVHAGEQSAGDLRSSQ